MTTMTDDDRRPAPESDAVAAVAGCCLIVAAFAVMLVAWAVVIWALVTVWGWIL